MKRNFILGLIAVLAMGSAQAQLGGLGGLMGGSRGSGGGIDVDKAVREFNVDAVLMREAMFFAMVQINAALLNKKDSATTQAALQAYQSKTKSEEQGAVQGDYIKTNMSNTNLAMASKEGRERLEKLDPEMKQRVAKSIFSVGVIALRMPKTIDSGKKIIESVSSNPMNISKVIPVKDGLSLFADILPKLPEFVSVGMQMMRDVKVDPGNPSADATIVAVKEPPKFDD